METSLRATNVMYHNKKVCERETVYTDETREQKVVHYNQQGERIVKTKTKT